MIKQLNEAHQPHTEAPWQIEGKDVGHVSLVAQVVQVKPQATNTVYWLDDSTGRIEARRWRDSGVETEEDPIDNIESNSWVRVTGLMKTYNNKRHLSQVAIRPVTDPNEIWYHLADVIVVTLMSERGAPGQPSQSHTQAASNGLTASAYTAQSSGNSGNSEYAGLPRVQRAILEWIQAQVPCDEGFHIKVISRSVQATEDEFAQALDQLMENGHVFTTTNDTHVALAQ
ncbi:hypothetical protein K488DRAFT_76271 [Vararia minispora EC-137]|uniref:Uncharacterized protein n=1 Tax=Vararia minispora EC-137 TaxID=1314806 RepID=A0ACB8QVT5_9AGAM|nr:hypothetical protein K488DRAFT_76271 [Vararia minispora EC-137]